MKPFLLLIATLAFYANSYSQTIVYSEDFEGATHSFTLNTTDVSSVGNAGYNQWIVNDAYTGGSGSLICLGFPFTFVVNNTPTQPTGITNSPTSKYMHIISDEALAGNIFCSSFLAADGICFFNENNFTAMTSDISTTGLNNVSFSFWWSCAGSASNYGEAYFSVDGGLNWLLAGAQVFSGSSAWTQATFTNIGFSNQNTIRFGFRFVNMTTVSAFDPAFNIDDIEVTANCMNTNSSIVDTACVNYTVPSGDETYAMSGMYSDTIPNTAGCDSIIAIDLHIPVLDTGVSLSGDTLSSQAMGVNYQWLDCDNNMLPVPGATNQSYTPVNGGLYAVVVGEGPCSDTSACIPVITSSINNNSLDLNYNLYPNPADDQISVSFTSIVQAFRINLYNSAGQKYTSTVYWNTNTASINVSDLPAGIYFVEIIADDSIIRRKITVE